VTRTIPQQDLRNRNAEIMAEVAAGECFVITRNGVPVAELRPLTTRRRRFVPKSEISRTAATAPQIDAVAFRRDLDELIDQRLIDHDE
jgi:prevent-host-death family protein